MELHPFFLPASRRGHDPVAHRGEVRQRLLTTLGRHLGRKIADSDLTFNHHGKPSLYTGEIHFNLSHSGDWLYIVLSSVAVGVDIERCKPRRAGLALGEFLALRCEGTLKEIDKQAIVRIWSRLEALTKCAGVGMTVPLGGIRVPAEPLPQPATVAIADKRYWLADLPAAPGYCAAVVCAGEPECIQVHAPSDVRLQLGLQSSSVRLRHHPKAIEV